MQNEQDFSNLIYEYFFLRIRFGYYRCGDSLPPIDTLCREFNVAPLTVTAALRRLRSEGFISMHNGRPTMVLYQLKEREEEEFCLRFFLRTVACIYGFICILRTDSGSSGN